MINSIFVVQVNRWAPQRPVVFFSQIKAGNEEAW
jgi:hypothetical protein